MKEKKPSHLLHPPLREAAPHPDVCPPVPLVCRAVSPGTLHRALPQHPVLQAELELRGHSHANPLFIRQSPPAPFTYRALPQHPVLQAELELRETLMRTVIQLLKNIKNHMNISE